jgi:hypothetical protein
MIPRLFSLLAAVLFLFAVNLPLRAQFYAPETDYHDVAQRHFVVELARVLAWREDQQGGKIAQVTYEVRSADDHTTSWKIHWLDASAMRCAISM